VIKKELIRRIAASSPHLRGSDAEKTVNAVLEGITAALARGDRVEIRGIGAFTVRVRRGASPARRPPPRSLGFGRVDVFRISGRANRCAIG
jgi:integration host factor subunit beta